MKAPESPSAALADVAASGDQGATLRALRDRLAQQIDGTDSARDVAQLGALLDKVLDRIAALPAEAKGTPLDELRARRAAGDGIASRPPRPGRGSV